MYLKTSAKILLFILGIFITLEATARLYYFGWDGFNFPKMNSFGDNHPTLTQPSEDPEISYELRRNLDTYAGARITTNSQGFRDKEYSRAKPPHTFRVAVVGASFVNGGGLEIEEAFHSVLEDRLNREKRGLTYEFINMGVGGHSPWQSLAVLKKKALAYEPDLILFAPNPSGYKTARESPRAGTPRRIAPTPPIFFNSHFTMLVKVRLKAWLNQSKAKGKAAGRVDMENFHKHVNEIFSELGEIQKQIGIPICVVFLEHQNSSLRRMKELEGPARRYGLPFIDTSEPFARAGFPNNCVHPISCHPNARAHRIFADAIYDFLMSRHLLEGTGKRAKRDL